MVSQKPKAEDRVKIVVLKDKKNRLSGLNKENQMASIFKVNPWFNKIRIHKGIPTLKIRK